MTRFPVCVTIAAMIAVLTCTAATARADVTLDISGTFGSYSWDPASPLNNGSFSGIVTLPSVPGANTKFSGDVSASISFYDSTVQSSSNLLFTVTNTVNSPVWATLTAGSSGYTQLAVSGFGAAGSSTVNVAGLDLNFSNWALNAEPGTANSSSSIEYTYLPSTTYFAPVTSGTVTESNGEAAATLLSPEPSTIAVSLVSVVAFLAYTRCKRRPLND
jgi:hypothetical protein